MPIFISFKTEARLKVLQLSKERHMLRIYQSMEIDLSSLFYPILWQISQLKKEILLMSQQ